MDGDSPHIRFLPHDFYNWLFHADPPETEPLINSPSIGLTLLQITIATVISGKIIQMARRKVIQIKKSG